VRRLGGAGLLDVYSFFALKRGSTSEGNQRLNLMPSICPPLTQLPRDNFFSLRLKHSRLLHSALPSALRAGESLPVFDLPTFL
jgi:hypothetical protein